VNRVNRETLQEELFLRSINVSLDARHPERIAHYRPTRKSVNLAKALLGFHQDKCTLVVAPYGSGKSLTAAYVLHLVENRSDSQPVLRELQRRHREVDPDLAKFASSRRNSGEKGLVIVLTGHQSHLPSDLKVAVLEAMERNGLGREARSIRRLPSQSTKDALHLLGVLQAKLDKRGCDRIILIWDEFGRHLESLVNEGRGHELGYIQTLAELFSRMDTVPASMGLLLHQTLIHYSTGLPSNARRDWKKIEGRFRILQFVDDSLEMSHLIAQIVAERGPRPVHAAKNFLGSTVKEIAERRWFGDCGVAELMDLFEQASPLEPSALYLLPRLSARVAQNERTLFSFLYSADLQKPVGPAEVYDYFSSEMQADTSAGGTHRRWMETESALSKVAGRPLYERIIKTASLMSLGLSGERAAVGIRDLLLAASGLSENRTAVQLAIDELIRKNLLLHRRNSDHVSVWHGTDLDLRGRLELEKDSQRQEFSLLTFLERECPPPIYRPVAHNAKIGIRRFFRGSFITFPELQQIFHQNLVEDLIGPGIDGHIFYLLSGDQAELDHAHEVIEAFNLPSRIVVSLPRQPLQIKDAALEVYCLDRMRHDPDIIVADPLAVQELTQLLDDAHLHLTVVLNHLTIPSVQGPVWYQSNSSHNLKSLKELRAFLSNIMDEEFNETPRFVSEAINRHAPTAVMVNARKKLNLGVLERYGMPMLGIEGNFPDASMFRSVFLNTGLYREEAEGLWRFVQPAEISDKRLAKVWGLFKDLLTKPSAVPKPLCSFFDELQLPPFGLRRGLFPLLFSAALRAFPTARSISRKGEFIPDVLPSVIEDLCKNPDDYELVVLHLDDVQLTNLKLIRDCLGGQGSSSEFEDILRQCFDALQIWVAKLSQGALRSRRISKEAKAFRKAILRTRDPVELFLKLLPQRVGQENILGTRTVEGIQACVAELQSFQDQQLEQAAHQLRLALGLGSGDKAELRQVFQEWVSSLPSGIVSHLKDTKEKGLVVCVQGRFDSEKRFIEAIGSHVMDALMSQWDDAALGRFGREVHFLIQRVEQQAFDVASHETLLQTETINEAIFKRRVKYLFARLSNGIGQERAIELFKEAVEGEQE